MLEFLSNNWRGIVLATVVAMAIGSLWYSNLLFGKQWQKLAKLSDKDLKNSRAQAMVIMLVMAFVSAYVLKRFLVISDPKTVLEAVKVAAWIWLGFVATYVISGGVFEKRPPKLMALHLGNQLITLVVMAAILFNVN